MGFIIVRRIAILFVVALIAAACSGSGGKETTTTAAPTTTTGAVSTTPAPATTTTGPVPTTVTATTTVPAVPEQPLSFVEELSGDVETTGTSYEYTKIWDNDGVFVIEIPTAWADPDGEGRLIDDERAGHAISASPNLQKYYGGWDTPGVFVGVSTSLLDGTEPGDLLDRHTLPACAYDGRYDFDNGDYTGRYDIWLNCGGTNTVTVNLEAYPEDRSFVVLVQIQAITDADLEALDRILATFYVDFG